jgi:hypothetical protein
LTKEQINWRGQTSKGKKVGRPNGRKAQPRPRLGLAVRPWWLPERDPYSPLNAGASACSAQSGIELGRPISDGIGFLSFFLQFCHFLLVFNLVLLVFSLQFLVLPIGFSELSKI